MEFCKHCGAILKAAICSCGCANDIEKIITEKQEKQDIKIITDEIDIRAAHDHICPKCGFGKAQLVTKGFMVSDEDESAEFICGKCGYRDIAEGLRVR